MRKSMTDFIRGRSQARRSAWTQLRVSVRHPLRVTRAPELSEGRESEIASVSAVVFSKNRAMQLDACLRSIEAFAPYTGRIVVIYRATSREFKAGYQSLRLGARAVLVEETSDFRRDVIDAVRSGEDGYTVFHTDDDVFFRRPPAVPAFSDEFATFSLRLGRNT